MLQININKISRWHTTWRNHVSFPEMLVCIFKHSDNNLTEEQITTIFFTKTTTTRQEDKQCKQVIFKQCIPKNG